MVYDYDDVRGALQPDDKGRAWRGNTEAVRRLVDSVDARISTWFPQAQFAPTPAGYSGGCRAGWLSR